MPACQAQDAHKLFARCENDRAVFLMCEDVHYTYMRTRSSAIVSASALANKLSSPRPRCVVQEVTVSDDDDFDMPDFELDFDLAPALDAVTLAG